MIRGVRKKEAEAEKKKRKAGASIHSTINFRKTLVGEGRGWDAGKEARGFVYLNRREEEGRVKRWGQESLVFQGAIPRPR